MQKSAVVENLLSFSGGAVNLYQSLPVRHIYIPIAPNNTSVVCVRAQQSIPAADKQQIPICI